MIKVLKELINYLSILACCRAILDPPPLEPKLFQEDESNRWNSASCHYLDAFPAKLVGDFMAAMRPWLSGMA
jgi:hypothetical protein